MRTPFDFGTASPNDGETFATAFVKIETMFKEVYNALRRRPRRGGRYRPPHVVSTGTTSMPQGKIFAMPYMIAGNGTDGGTITDLEMQITTAGAQLSGVDCNLKVAIFGDNGAGAPDPTKLVADCTLSGLLSGMSTGVKSCAAAGNAFSIQPAPGDILWVVMAAYSAVTVTGVSTTAFIQFLPMDSAWTANVRLEATVNFGAGNAFPDISSAVFSVGNGSSPMPVLIFS